MKTIRTLRLATAACLSALSLTAVAAPPPGHEPDHGDCSLAMHAGHHGVPPMALHRLDLSEAQRDKVFELMHGQARQRHELMRELQRNRDALRELARAPQFDADRARALADESGKLHSRQAFEQAQMMSQLRALLTPEQLKRLDERGEPARGERRGHAHRQDAPR